MTTTGFSNFDKTVQKTNELLDSIEKEFGWEDRRGESYSVLREILHALRDRLGINESAHFASQLPMLLRGVYYDGWDPAKVPMKMDRDEFLNRIRTNLNYSFDEDMESIVRMVFDKIFESTNENSRISLIASLPEDIATLLQ